MGIKDLSWNSESIYIQSAMKRHFGDRFFSINLDILEYLIKLRQPVERLQVRMQKTQFNLSEIKRITSMWVKQPLFERKDGKKDSVLCLNERLSRVAKRYGEIEVASNTIHR